MGVTPQLDRPNPKSYSTLRTGRDFTPNPQPDSGRIHDLEERAMTYGQGDYQYELVENWGNLPEGYEWHQVAGVAVDSNDNVYAYNRSEHQLMIFDSDGNFLDTWLEVFAGPHGIHIDPNDNVYLADRDAHTVMKYNTSGRMTLKIGTGRASDTGYTTNAEPVPARRRPLQPAHRHSRLRRRRHLHLRRLRQRPRPSLHRHRLPAAVLGPARQDQPGRLPPSPRHRH